MLAALRQLLSQEPSHHPPREPIFASPVPSDDRPYPFLGAAKPPRAVLFRNRSLSLVAARHGTYLADARDMIDSVLLEYGEWDEEVAEVLRAFVREGDIVLEAGTNVGPYTILLSRLVGGRGRVVSVEPQLHVASRLHANLVLNGASNVLVHQVALGAGPVRAAVHVGQHGPHGAAGQHDQRGAAGTDEASAGAGTEESFVQLTQPKDELVPMLSAAGTQGQSLRARVVSASERKGAALGLSASRRRRPNGRLSSPPPSPPPCQSSGSAALCEDSAGLLQTRVRLTSIDALRLPWLNFLKVRMHPCSSLPTTAVAEVVLP